MGNLCSIYHAHFDKLFSLTNKHSKAVFLDKCLFWWQISKYTLNDNLIWFTRTIPEMAKELGLSNSSVSRYLDEFEQEGLLARTCKLMGSKKRLYIRVTPKLLDTVHLNSTQPNALITETKAPCVFLTQNDIIENVTLTKPIYKEQELNCFVNNTTVSNESIVDKQPPKFKSYAIEAHIGELLSIREKNYIKGVMNQLTQSEPSLISNPNQLFAEIVFSVTNEHQFKGITNFNHKLQIISKLIRERRWMTPKGFFNHSDFGRFFKAYVNESACLTPVPTNKFSTPHARIKELKAALLDVISERTSNESYLREMYERAQSGLVVSQAVLDSIQSKITKSGILEREYSQALDALMASQKQEGRAVTIQPIQSNWAQYDALCTQQRVVEQELERATRVYGQALNGGFDSVATQKATDDYLCCMEQYELINEQLFQLGELLNQKKSA